MRYLLDTNIVSEAAKPRPHPGVVARIHERFADCAISALTWHELLFGLQRLPESPRRGQIAGFVERVAGLFPVLPYDRAAANWHAAERARLAGAGRVAPWADGQIAATAASLKLVLVTRNVRDYSPFSGLAIENWFEA
jgi:tRNA(fMet)-specific endonuclease VapC